MNDSIGTDISKDTLDTFWLSKRKHTQFANTKVGLKALVRWVREADVSLVVFEATIARQGMRSMPEREVFTTGCWKPALQSIIFLLHGSIDAWRAASPKGPGHWPKRTVFLLGDASIACQATDAVMLARMGSLLEMQADKPKSETLHNLKPGRP